MAEEAYGREKEALAGQRAATQREKIALEEKEKALKALEKAKAKFALYRDSHTTLKDILEKCESSELLK